MRLKNQLSTFVDFTWEDLDMEEQVFEDYKSKYLDLYEKVKNGTGKEKVSILEDVDFELELIHRDEINVRYILGLLEKLIDTPEPGHEAGKKQVFDLLAGQVSLRSKRELIEKFIEENLVHIADSDDITDQFNRFWTIEKDKAFADICTGENLSPEKCRAILDKYMYTSREPLRDDVLDMLLGKKPGVRERKLLAQRIISKLTGFVETFINGIDI
jgi:type I restriction enzyme R subunit